MSRNPDGFTIFCDDIRHEVGGKVSFIGCYSGILLVHSPLPLILPKFAFGIFYREYGTDWNKDSIEVLIYLPSDGDDGPFLRQTIPTSSPVLPNPDYMQDTDEGTELVTTTALNAIVTSMPIKTEGYIKVRAISNGIVTKVGSLFVKMQPPQKSD